jgi:hypothetical protein
MSVKTSSNQAQKRDRSRKPLGCESMGTVSSVSLVKARSMIFLWITINGLRKAPSAPIQVTRVILLRDCGTGKGTSSPVCSHGAQHVFSFLRDPGNRKDPILFAVPGHCSLRNARYFGDHRIRHNRAMFDVSHSACMVALVAHMLNGHKEFVRLKALNYLLGGKRLDSLPVDVVLMPSVVLCTFGNGTRKRPALYRKNSMIALFTTNGCRVGGLSTDLTSCTKTDRRIQLTGSLIRLIE